MFICRKLSLTERAESPTSASKDTRSNPSSAGGSTLSSSSTASNTLMMLAATVVEDGLHGVARGLEQEEYFLMPAPTEFELVDLNSL